MMQIRPIRSDELDAFCAVGTTDDNNEGRAAAVRTYLGGLFANGNSHLDWCYVPADADAAAGFTCRVAFWKIPGRSRPDDFILLDVPWADSGAPAIATRFLAAVGGEARRLGAETLGHALDRPAQAPQWQEHPDVRDACLHAAGFSVARDTTRFEWLPDRVSQGNATSRLVFRGWEELGEAPFVAAVRAVTEGTLDQRLGDERDEAGPEAHARAFVAEMEELGRLPGWWQLGYDAGGDLVGLIMLSGHAGWATIGYVGVVPARRGAGFIDDLLVKGDAVLRKTGIARAIADTDLANRPMDAALRRHGWREFATRREYTRRLTETP